MRIIIFIYAVIMFSFISIYCNNGDTIKYESESHREIIPEYNRVKITTSQDTIKIPMDSLTSSSQLVLNHYIELDNKELLVFTDALTSNVLLVDLQTGHVLKKIHLNSEVVRAGKLFAYLKSKDSLLIASEYKLYLVDTTGKIKNEINLLSNFYSNKSSVITALPFFYTSLLPVFIENNLYLGALADLSPSKFSDLKKWPVLYKINLKESTYSLIHHLPKIYTKKLFAAEYAIPFYCYNDITNRFVYSFPADNNIYETNFDSSISYIGKSNFFTNEIESATVNQLSRENSIKFYLTHNSYGPIFHDKHRRHYLRVAEMKINDKEFENKQWTKNHTLIIFDDKFKIIGESRVDKQINVFNMFCNAKGVYARFDPIKKDENNLYFIRLDYSQ